MHCQKVQVKIQVKNVSVHTFFVNSQKKCVYGNWKLHWWFCSKVSFADVVKNNVKMSQVVESGKVKAVKRQASITTKQLENTVSKNISKYCSSGWHLRASKIIAWGRGSGPKSAV